MRYILMICLGVQGSITAAALTERPASVPAIPTQTSKTEVRPGSDPVKNGAKYFLMKKAVQLIWGLHEIDKQTEELEESVQGQSISEESAEDALPASYKASPDDWLKDIPQEASQVSSQSIEVASLAVPLPKFHNRRDQGKSKDTTYYVKQKRICDDEDKRESEDRKARIKESMSGFTDRLKQRKKTPSPSSRASEVSVEQLPDVGTLEPLSPLDYPKDDNELQFEMD